MGLLPPSFLGSFLSLFPFSFLHKQKRIKSLERSLRLGQPTQFGPPPAHRDTPHRKISFFILISSLFSSLHPPKTAKISSTMPAVDVSSVPAVSGKEVAQSIAVLEDLIKNLNVSTSADEVNAAANNLATLFSGPIAEQALPLKAVETFKKQLSNKKDALVRERACEGIRAIASHTTIAPGVEPHLVSLLGPVLNAVGDKMVPVKEAAQSAAAAIVQAVNGNAVKAVVTPILDSLQNAQKWPEKMAALKCLDALVETAPAQLSFQVPRLIPVVSEAMWDTKADIKKAAYSTMEKVCGLIVNKDIERFIPELIKCISKPENVPETVHLLGATTFVSAPSGTSGFKDL
jgi:elongation factor 3